MRVGTPGAVHRQVRPLSRRGLTGGVRGERADIPVPAGPAHVPRGILGAQHLHVVQVHPVDGAGVVPDRAAGIIPGGARHDQISAAGTVALRPVGHRVRARAVVGAASHDDGQGRRDDGCGAGVHGSPVHRPGIGS